MTNRYGAALGRIGARVRMATFTPDKRRRIAGKARATRTGGALPESLRPLFQGRDFASIRLPKDKTMVMLAILTHGSSEQIRWLTIRYGRGEIRRWIRAGKGRGLNREQLLPWFGISPTPGAPV